MKDEHNIIIIVLRLEVDLHPDSDFVWHEIRITILAA